MVDAEETKSLIRGVVTSTPEDVTIMRLNKDFRSLVGRSIPFQELGFECLELYLYSIHYKVIGRGSSAIVKACSSEKSAHMNKLIGNQKRNPRGGRYGGNFRSFQPHFNKRQFGGPSQRPYRYGPPRVNGAQYIPPLMSFSAYNQHNTNKSHPRDAPSTSGFNYNSSKPPEQRRQYNNSPVSPPRKEMSPTFAHCKAESNYSNTTEVDIKTDSTRMNKSTSPIIKASLESRAVTPNSEVKLIPGGLESVSDNTEESYDEGDEIFNDSDDDLGTVRPNKSPQGRDLDAASAGCSSGVNRALVGPSNCTYNIRVPRDVQDNLIELITSEEGKDGIWCGKLCDVYKKHFGGNLNAERYGFPTLLAMCVELPGIFHCIQIQRGDYKVFNSRQPYPKDIIKMNTFVRKLESINNPSVSQAVSNVPPFPEDHMAVDYFALNDQIPRLELGSFLSVNDIIDVRIAEVYDPSKFWLYIVGKEYSDKLNNMMDEIQTFYADKSKILVISKEKMLVGLLCCASYFKEFHRAVIIDTNLPKPHLVKVFFLDYGTVGKVQLTSVLYLHRQFGVLPQQAIRTRLAGIYPPEAKTPWSREAGRRFFELVYERQLIAQIDKINDKRHEIDIFLTDTSSEIDVHIPDKLVEEGYAIFIYDEQAPVKLSWHFDPIVQYIHLYPTFQEIETGRVHTITEMSQLAELGVPYYIAYSHYFCQKEDSNSPTGNKQNIPPDVICHILETNSTAPVDETATWVEKIDNSNISDIVSITDIEAEPFRRVIIADCNGEKMLLIRFNNKVHLDLQQLLHYFKKDLTIIQIRRLCVYMDIKIACIAKHFYEELFEILTKEHFCSSEETIHVLPVEDVPSFYERITGEEFSLDNWPSIEKILSFSSDIWVK